jgi:hypothetical protein
METDEEAEDLPEVPLTHSTVPDLRLFVWTNVRLFLQPGVDELIDELEDMAIAADE